MRVLHIADTPVAGSPIRIVKALRQHLGIDARLLVLSPRAYGKRVFENDLLLPDDLDEISEYMETADIIHTHQSLSVENLIMKHKLPTPRGRTINQLHSPPAHYERHNVNIDLDGTPQLVVAQYQERYYPNARPVPNITPIPLPLEEIPFPDITTFHFAPSVFFPMLDSHHCRWETKGAPEMARVIQYLCEKSGYRMFIETNVPHDTCMSHKANSSIVIDDLVTGSFHLSALEGLALGKATVTHLDSRSQASLSALTGASYMPFVNVRLEESEPVLRDLGADLHLQKEIGDISRHWFDKYYRPEQLVRHYHQAYMDLINNPDALMPNRLPSAHYWLATTQYDLSWNARKNAIINSQCLSSADISTEINDERSKHESVYNFSTTYRDNSPSYRLVEQLISYCRRTGVRSILDVGHATGRTLHRLLEEGFDAWGIDFASNSVLPELQASLSQRAITASANSMPFGNGHFDLVLCFDLMEHIPECLVEEVLREIRRVGRGSILFNIDTQSDIRCGTELHVTRRPAEWWHNAMRGSSIIPMSTKWYSWFNKSAERWTIEKDKRFLTLANSKDESTAELELCRIVMGTRSFRPIIHISENDVARDTIADLLPGAQLVQSIETLFYAPDNVPFVCATNPSIDNYLEIYHLLSHQHRFRRPFVHLTTSKSSGNVESAIANACSGIPARYHPHLHFTRDIRCSSLTSEDKAFIMNGFYLGLQEGTCEYEPMLYPVQLSDVTEKRKAFRHTLEYAILAGSGSTALVCAGQYTRRMRDIVGERRHLISSIFDDNQTGSFEGIPIYPLNEITELSPLSILISADSVAEIITTRLEAIGYSGTICSVPQQEY